MDERREWSFPEGTDSPWWDNYLATLIGKLESLTAPGTGLLTENGVSEEGGWSMPLRLASAERLRVGFAPGGEFALRWKEALPATESV